MMEEPKSKSQKKREAESLQHLGLELMKLSLKQLQLLPLPALLEQAILDAKSLKSHGALRRQAQWIGKLMRTADMEALISAYEQLKAEDSAKTAAFHDAEHWRARLINEGNSALTEFIASYHPEDVQQLRQLLKKAIQEQETDKPAGASKALFRYIRPYLE